MPRVKSFLELNFDFSLADDNNFNLNLPNALSVIYGANFANNLRPQYENKIST